ncbi:hypothetical protein EDB87DRAFT_1677141 [Lactarius vividus]|nr:hypothetical protein EDB87DRAFT_1677141 [Lactarius vividus]
MAPDAVAAPAPAPAPARPCLRKITPYWYPYRPRFIRARVRCHYYQWQNRQTWPIVCNGDRNENVVHRHDPPVTSRPVKILHEHRESKFIIIDKPGSIPVHETGRYFYLFLVGSFSRNLSTRKFTVRLYRPIPFPSVNRLDRLTSCLMMIGLSSSRADVLSQEFVQGEVKNEYIARYSGEFPAEEVVVDQPLLTVDRQMGLNIVHPEGKASNRSLYVTRLYGVFFITHLNTSCLTFDTTPSDDRAPPVAPAHLVGTDTADSTHVAPGARTSILPFPQLLPRKTGKDIGMGSPAVGVITCLRNMKDGDEDWSRWCDVVFKAKGRLHPTGMPTQKLPPQNRRKLGGPAWADAENTLTYLWTSKSKSSSPHR